MSERQFIPVEGDPTLTEAEREAREEKAAAPGPKSMSGLKKLAGAAAMVGAAALHPEAANAQQQSQDNKQKIEQVEKSEAQAIEKMQGWLDDMAADRPELKGAVIDHSGREAGITVGVDNHSEAYTITPKESKESFVIRSHEDGSPLTLSQFISEINGNLERIKFQGVRAEQKYVTDEMANKWMAELSSSDPDLQGVTVGMDRRAGGIANDGAFRLYAGKDEIYSFTIPAAQDTQEEFNARVREFLNGDVFKKETPAGVNMEFGKGAAKVIGATRIRFDRGSVTFFEMPGHTGFNLAGSHSENQTLRWEKMNDTDLKLTVIEKDGAIYEYPIRKGILHDEEEKKVK